MASARRHAHRARAAAAGSTGPTGSPTAICCSASLLMFGPVLWLVLSSFKTRGGAQRVSAAASCPTGRRRSTVPGDDEAAAAVSRDAARRHDARAGRAAAHRHPGDDGRPGAARRRKSRSTSATGEPVREFQLATENYTELFGKFDFGTYPVEQRVHHRRRDADHAAVQRDGGVRAVEVPVPRPQGGVPADPRRR